jgi:DNA modification methylase
MTRARLLCGDVREVLASLPDRSVRCCVTSPPYWGLRDYGTAGQLGLEPTPSLYVAAMVEVFREVRRVLADDGTLWLNLGDSYAAAPGGGQGKNGAVVDRSASRLGVREATFSKVSAGLKPKDLVGIPWRVAFALQDDGWYLRSDIIWHKPNPMPESVTDRPTKSHEYLFLLSKSERYFYDADAIAEPSTHAGRVVATNGNEGMTHGYDGNRTRDGFRRGVVVKDTKNIRTVWTIASQPYPGSHFATFPEELPRRCILAGSQPGDTVLEPFLGSGTTAAVAVGNGRHAIGIELNPEYLKLAAQRIGPMFCDVAA